MPEKRDETRQQRWVRTAGWLDSNLTAPSRHQPVWRWAAMRLRLAMRIEGSVDEPLIVFVRFERHLNSLVERRLPCTVHD